MHTKGTRNTWIKRIRYEYSQLPLLFHGTLERLLYVETLAHDGRVEFPFEGEQVHVGLRLGHQVAHLQPAPNTRITSTASSESTTDQK